MLINIVYLFLIGKKILLVINIIWEKKENINYNFPKTKQVL